jgi:GTP-binding protein EngB required for normal cell division
MIDKVLKELQEKVKKIEEKKNYFLINPTLKPTICVAGVVSAGKSKFLNFLLDTDIFESRISETTKEILEVGISKERDDSEKMLEKLPPHAIRFLEFVNVVDIPGYDGTLDEKVSNYLKEGNYNIVLYILDVSKGLTKMDNEFLKIISERNPYILFIINKIDIYEGEEKSDFEKLISFVKEKVEEFYPKDRILGYVLTSVKKFRNDKKFIEFFQNTLIIASYISTFETNLLIAEAYLHVEFEEAMNKEIKNWHRDYSNWYLKALKNGLHKIPNMDIIMNGEKSIKNLIEELNSELEYGISQDVEKIGDFFNGKIKEVVDFINNMSVSYSEILSLNLESSISDRISSVSVETPHLGSIDFSEAFNEVLVKIIGSIASGILARLALGALIPGIGTIVFIGSLLWTIIDADNKANEIRSKVYNEVASNLPKIMREEWMKICAQIEKEYKKQVDLIINSKGIKKFLNDLIKSTYKMNDKISKFIIEEFI